MFAKPKRIVNKELIEAVKLTPCVACGQRPSDVHHVTTRGAGGHDLPNNLMPLCHMHHVEWHKKGPTTMIKKYKGVLVWLSLYGRDDILERGWK